ncbi:hypothetical protein LINPERHAP1_LOCUS8399, partial [Linum perenne]
EHLYLLNPQVFGKLQSPSPPIDHSSKCQLELLVYPWDKWASKELCNLASNLDCSKIVMLSAATCLEAWKSDHFGLILRIWNLVLRCRDKQRYSAKKPSFPVE